MKKIDDIETVPPQTALGLEATVPITEASGLHARPAAKLAAIARTARHRVWIEANGEKVDAASTLDILSLGCNFGTNIRILIENPSDENVLKEILFFIESKFQEKTDHV